MPAVSRAEVSECHGDRAGELVARACRSLGAQKDGLEAVRRFGAAEFAGCGYCETVAKQVRNGFLKEGPITILLRRTEAW